jgi:catechol 2,3-dioxygenase-like lactoylglutathione lyase family enzyme
MSAPAIGGFSHVSLSVKDVDTSLRFYRDVLGLTVLAEPYDGTVFEGREAMLLTGRAALCLQAHDANGGDAFDPSQTGLDHIAFSIGSIDELHEFARYLDEQKVENSGVKPLPGFGDFIELRDPDGILVELHVLGA